LVYGFLYELKILVVFPSSLNDAPDRNWRRLRYKWKMYTHACTHLANYIILWLIFDAFFTYNIIITIGFCSINGSHHAKTTRDCNSSTLCTGYTSIDHWIYYWCTFGTLLLFFTHTHTHLPTRILWSMAISVHHRPIISPTII